MSKDCSRNQNQRRGRNSRQRSLCANINQRIRADEASDHRSTPVKRDITCRGSVRKASHRRLTKEVDKDTSNRDLRTDVSKDGHRSKAQMHELPRASTVG